MAGHFRLGRSWRTPKVVILLFMIEFCATIAMLALFGIADPDLYRTKLWQDGYYNGFNSDPNQILYDYANHRTPETPLVWSQLYVEDRMPTPTTCTNLHQHHQLQRRHLGPLHVHPARQVGHVRYGRLVPNTIGSRTFHLDRLVCRQYSDTSQS